MHAKEELDRTHKTELTKENELDNSHKAALVTKENEFARVHNKKMATFPFGRAGWTSLISFWPFDSRL